MTQPPLQNSPLKYYLSEPQPCAYLPDRKAMMVTLDPQVNINQSLYSQLAQFGFRRSGKHIYRPQCDTCQACIPLRVNVAQFRSNRSQRRAWKRNNDIQINDTAAVFDDQHFALFQHYINNQHHDGGMDNPDENDYLSFLTSPGINSQFFEFRKDDQLLAVAVTDRLDNGLSAVYTFYDTNHSKRSLGVFTLLWQIEHCRQLGLEWLYLGFWITACRKMSYKNHYRPCQILTSDGWLTLTSKTTPSSNPA